MAPMIIWAVVVLPAPPFVVASVIVLIRNPYQSVAWCWCLRGSRPGPGPVPQSSALQALNHPYPVLIEVRLRSDLVSSAGLNAAHMSRDIRFPLALNLQLAA
jgi:hypothetical protein